MEAEGAEPAISEAQWEAARQAFEDQLPSTAGLTVNKYELIVMRVVSGDRGARLIFSSGSRRPGGRAGGPHGQMERSCP